MAKLTKLLDSVERGGKDRRQAAQTLERLSDSAISIDRAMASSARALAAIGSRLDAASADQAEARKKRLPTLAVWAALAGVLLSVAGLLLANQQLRGLNESLKKDELSLVFASVAQAGVDVVEREEGLGVAGHFVLQYLVLTNTGRQGITVVDVQDSAQAREPLVDAESTEWDFFALPLVQVVGSEAPVYNAAFTIAPGEAVAVLMRTEGNAQYIGSATVLRSDGLQIEVEQVGEQMSTVRPAAISAAYERLRRSSEENKWSR